MIQINQTESFAFEDILFSFALESEAAEVFKGNNVLFTGIGKVNAAYELTKAIQKKKPTIIINLGSAGSSCFQKGEVICCTKFVQRDMDVSPLGFAVGVTPMDDEIPAEIHAKPHFEILPKGICGTGDSFETGIPKIICNIVDMEAYALAKVCQKLGVRLISVKYISDGANDTAHLDWEENLLLGAQKLLALYQAHF